MVLAGLIVWSAAAPGTTAGAGDIVFREDFDVRKGGADLRARGWTVAAPPDRSRWEIDDGALKITHFYKVGRGGYIDRAVPVVRRGTLDFDARIGNANNRHLSLQVFVYGIFTAYHGGQPHRRIAWDRYCAKLLGDKNGGWQGLRIRIPPDTWHHYRIAFDADANVIEYYVDDMDDPVHVDAEVPVLGAAFGKDRQLASIRLGNYGYCLGTVVTHVDNLVLRRLPPGSAAATPAAGANALVFRGMAAGRYRLNEALDILKPPRVKAYVVEQGLALFPKNVFRVDRYPGRQTLDGAGLIVLADVPLGPGEVMPDWLVRALEARVRAGATLVVLGGMWTLNKGGFRGTPLEPMLPVTLAGPWAVREVADGSTIEPAVAALRGDLAWAEKPTLMWAHDLAAKPDARVLLHAGEQPLLVSGRHGEGRVIVFLGMPCGQAPRSTTAFWTWRDWPRLLARVVRYADAEK